MTKKNNIYKILCPKCDKEVGIDDTFCPYCGERIDAKSSSKEKEIPIVETEIINDKKNSKSVKYDGDNVKKNTFENSKKIIYPIIAVVITLIICVAAFFGFYKYYLKNLVIETTKSEVTITDTGIADAVSKVYDSVVVVESYVNGRLYSTGTGFIYKTDDNNGYILTNEHVIDGASEVKVVLTNDKEITVKIVGSDSYSDIAVLSIDKSEVISVAEIGSSEKLRVGDTSFAVGAPVNASSYAWTVTRGIISGKNRLVSVSATTTSSAYIAEVLQTDTAINNGNSGGPLCNSNGEVIGITNMKLASSTIEGMGFAIPIETAVKYADKFISGESIERPYLGVTLTDGLNTNNSYSYYFGGSATSTGVYVNSVEDDSPALAAGIEKGDKIVAVGDTSVEDVAHFKYELYKYEIGDKVSLKISRDGKEQVIEVTVASTSLKA